MPVAFRRGTRQTFRLQWATIINSWRRKQLRLPTRGNSLWYSRPHVAKTTLLRSFFINWQRVKNSLICVFKNLIRFQTFLNISPNQRYKLSFTIQYIPLEQTWFLPLVLKFYYLSTILLYKKLQISDLHCSAGLLLGERKLSFSNEFEQPRALTRFWKYPSEVGKIK